MFIRDKRLQYDVEDGILYIEHGDGAFEIDDSDIGLWISAFQNIELARDDYVAAVQKQEDINRD